MKVVYSNTSHWQLTRWITIVMSVTSCAIMVWILVQLFGVDGRDTGADDLLQVCLPVLIVGVIFMEQNYLDVLTVDEDPRHRHVDWKCLGTWFLFLAAIHFFN